MTHTKGILLTRRSPFQIYCANQLWRMGLISQVIVEEGQSYASENSVSGISSLWRKVRSGLEVLRSNPTNAVEHTRVLLSHGKYFGSQELHNQRIFGNAYEEFNINIPVVAVPNVNSEITVKVLAGARPSIAFVFGTRIIKPFVFGGSPIPFVNLHWGWSPDYRGEGIITALAFEGPTALGVTVHLLAEGIDSGDILYRSKPTIEKMDNFYSLGLKLTKLGIDGFSECARRVDAGEILRGVPQDLAKGGLRGSKYLRDNPSVYRKAWKNLRRASFDTSSL